VRLRRLNARGGSSTQHQTGDPLVAEGTVDDDEPLSSGQLVRYLETTTRWYFARVQRARAEEIELAFFDGSTPTKVARA
jgi:hypothetical protein